MDNEELSEERMLELLRDAEERLSTQTTTPSALPVSLSTRDTR